MPDELLATCWTTAGDAAPLRGDERSPHPLRARVEAAAAAGFSGFGLLLTDLDVAERDYGRAGIRALLADNGITRLELELLTDWWADGAARQASDAFRRRLLDAAEAFGADHVKIAPDTAARPWDSGHWAAELATLAEQAERAGTRVALEFLPWANVRTVGDGLRLVEAAGHPAAGLLIDVWHTERAGTPAAELAEVPLARIVGVELSDADAVQVGTLFEDTVARRRLCGQGSFDLKGDIAALRAAGWTGPWGVEILADDFRALPLAEAITAAAQTAAAVLAEPG